MTETTAPADDLLHADIIGGAQAAILLRLRLIFGRATPGPWHTYQDGVHPCEVGPMGSGDDYAICTHGPKSYANADWIAAVHNDWPMIEQLIGELCERLRHTSAQSTADRE